MRNDVAVPRRAATSLLARWSRLLDGSPRDENAALPGISAAIPRSAGVPTALELRERLGHVLEALPGEEPSVLDLCDPDDGPVDELVALGHAVASGPLANRIRSGARLVPLPTWTPQSVAQCGSRP